MLVRRAQQKDAEAIARMVAAASAADGRQAGALDAELVRAHAFGPQALLEAWVAEERRTGTAIGCALAHTGYDVEAACATLVVVALFVAPEVRKAGLARMIVGQIAERAMELGARELIITTGVENAGARAFFASIGATESKVAQFVLGRDQIEWLAEEGA